MKKKLHTKLVEFVENKSLGEMLVELAQISDLGDFSSTNISVFVYGGEGFRTEHGIPHFSVYLDRNRKQNINIQIPEIDDPLEDLNIIVSFDKKGWKQRSWLKKELLRWLKEPSHEFPMINNHNAIIRTWNLFNKNNKNVRKMTTND